MKSYVINKKRLSVTVAALALASVLSMPVYAAMDPADVPTTRTKDHKDFPEMTADDCRNLASDRRKYKKSEYMSRKDYCRRMEKSGPAGSGSSSNSPAAGSGTAGPASNAASDTAGRGDNPAGTGTRGGTERMGGSRTPGSTGTGSGTSGSGTSPDMGTGGSGTGTGSSGGNSQ